MAGCVTVSVYVPVAFTVGVAVFAPLTIPGPVHENVTPPVLLLPFNTTEGVVQSIVLSGPALAFGGVVEVVTAAWSVFVQPVAVTVTVSV